MADFCAPCVVEIFGPGTPRERNDFAGWLSNPDDADWAWGLCEGCGNHLINDLGERWCGNRPAREALDSGAALSICTSCAHDL